MGKRVVAARSAVDGSDAAPSTSAPAAPSAQASHFKLNFLWMDRNVAVSVDQVLPSGGTTPVTEYYFWPRTDAWEELRQSLDGKSWINQADRVLLLNRTTEVINFWQDEDDHGHSLGEARDKFPDCTFSGI